MSKWQLDDLYTNYESEAFQKDWQQLKDFKEILEKVNLVDNLEAIKEIIAIKENYLTLSRRIGSFINLNLATNTTDGVFTNYQGQYRQIMSEMTQAITQINRFLGQISTDITKDEELTPYEFAFKELREQAQYMLDDELEAVMAKLSISGGSAWTALHGELTSTVETELNGETYTLSQIRNLAYDADATVRKEAYEAEIAMYDAIKTPIAHALNNIKKQVLTTTELRGYDSPLHATLIQSRMNEKTLDSLMQAIKKFIPEFRRYLTLKATYLGHENGLPFYDLFAPIGESKEKFTIEESGKYLVEKFATFSQPLADLVQHFYDNNYIDFLPRKGKRGGAFCSNLPFIGQSRILTNFDGSLSSVITLAHELGHAYHGAIIQEHKPLNWSYSMPVAETASTFNETIIMDQLIKEANSPNEQLALIESMLQDTNQIIVDIYSRYYFETELFKERQNNFLFPEQLEEMMKAAQIEAYGDGLDSNYLHSYMWINKGHYYSTGLSFYNFPYAYGGLFARGLYTYYQKHPENFVEKYNELLYQTTIASVEDVAKVMSIDVTDQAFWEESLQSYVEYIDMFEDLTK